MEYKALLRKINRKELFEKSAVKLIGYHNTIKEIRNHIRCSSNFLAIGPEATSKFTIIRKLAEESGQQYFYLDTRWFHKKSLGDPITLLEGLFEEAVNFAPSIIFIDKIHKLFGKKHYQADLSKISDVIMENLDYLARTSHKITMIAATSEPELLDPELVRCLGFKVHFLLPNESERLDMLRSLLPKFKLDELAEIAASTHCYRFCDLKLLRELAMQAGALNFSNIKQALKKVKPAEVESYTTPSPSVRWEEIGGFEDVKMELRRSLLDVPEEREYYERFRVDRERGALLFGPPGCSKTMLAQALATESGFNFILVKGPELFSKYVGDSEAAVRRLYKNAREISPCIIFLDEIDGFAADRFQEGASSVDRKIVNQLLLEFNGLADNVFTIAATNLPSRVDKALLRSGRLGLKIYIPLPSEADRAEIFKVKMGKIADMYGRPVGELAEILAARTPYYSGADIAQVVNKAGTLAARDKAQFITLGHFEEALKRVKPSTGEKDLDYFKAFQQECLETGQNEEATESVLSASNLDSSHQMRGIIDRLETI